MTVYAGICGSITAFSKRYADQNERDYPATIRRSWAPSGPEDFGHSRASETEGGRAFPASHSVCVMRPAPVQPYGSWIGIWRRAMLAIEDPNRTVLMSEITTPSTVESGIGAHEGPLP